ncbi:MAG: carboxypeptidase regulatory-like domain-containing protein [Kiritimatiellia bacterium]|jgi:plastocyanin|nr:carboxypeptidase regulatory-like domain-containing protein [Kiritimatiellia bacterium]MDP6630428.1 carboxypeptidase regulatory-like domain-containing protein [Kiritimatiellia bacterium]MDP6809885.1 carboxypeptidase regulatory-like domain-containing protein [Kiritimatiellia bacterium]MDP7024277.1 carboxypeptidase regulatory-like domain-containing protein [Kiritimatiellia bacterium]
MTGRLDRTKPCIALITAILALSTLDLCAGDINGTVKFKGKPRKPRPMKKLAADTACAAMHDTLPVDEKFVYAESGEAGVVTLGNVFVWVRGGLPETEYEIPAEPVVINQEGCTFVPHVLGIRAGQDLEIRNGDKTAHNVNAQPKRNKGFNNAQPPATRPLIKNFKREEVMVKFACDMHTWMSCYVGVVSHPFYAVTGKDGAFSLKNLPAGEYEVEVWHELLKTQSQTVKVADGEATSIEFLYAKP